MQRFLVLTALLAVCSGVRANTCVPLQAGATDQSVYVEFIDESTGIPNSSLAFNTSGIDLEYVRSGAAATDITEVTQTAAGAHSDGGFVSVGHGRYRLDLPDAAVASGVPQVVVQGVITGYIMLPCVVALSPPVNVVAAAGTAWASGAITAASIASDAITAAKIAANAIDAATFAADVDAEILSYIVDDATRIDASELNGDIDSLTFTVAGDVDVNVQTVGGTAITATGGRMETNTSHWGGTAVASAVVPANTIQISGDATAADNLEARLDATCGEYRELGIARGSCTAQAATSTTLQLDTSAAFADDTPIGMTLVACGSTQGYCQSRAVTDYVSSTDTATVDAWTVTPSGTITYYLFGTAPASGSGGSGATAQEVWEYGSRSLTVLDEDSTTIDLNGSAVGSVTSLGNGSGFTAIPWNSSWDAEVQSEAADAINADTGDSFTAVPWNASWDAEVQSEATDALNAYDPPTRAELTSDIAGLDALLDTIAAYLDTEIATLLNGVNVEQINGVTITGDGSGTPFGVTP